MRLIFISVCVAVAFFFINLESVSSQVPSLNTWSQFRGVMRDGKSNEDGLLNKWPVAGPQLLWKRDIGTGFSEVLVSGDKIFTMLGNKIDSVSGTEYVAAYEASSGKELWKTEIDSIFIDIDNWGDGPRSTPVIDENNIYCVSSFGKLAAFSLSDGKEQWKIDFMKEYATPLLRWGFTCSPMIVGKALIIEAGGKDSKAFIAVDKNNGETLWANGTVEPYYCSPLAISVNDKEQIIFVNGSTIYSFNSIGDTLWTHNMPLRSPTAIPVFIEPDKLMVSTAGPTGTLFLKVEDDNVYDILSTNTLQNHWSSSCYHNGYIYGFNNAALQCISVVDGTIKWKKRGFGKGSLVLIDNKLIILSDQGKLIMADINPEIYTEISSFQAIEGKSWTAPSFADGIMYLRNLTQMACYKLK